MKKGKCSTGSFVSASVAVVSLGVSFPLLGLDGFVSLRICFPCQRYAFFFDCGVYLSEGG